MVGTRVLITLKIEERKAAAITRFWVFVKSAAVQQESSTDALPHRDNLFCHQPQNKNFIIKKMKQDNPF
jgi:hypothetical protein